MATKKKMLQAAAGQAGGAALDITDVFSTYLYTGNGSTQTITNGIDLAGEGGLVWIKGRNAVTNHALVDTERGGANSLASDTTDAQRTDGAYGLTFNSDGFDSTGGNLNVSGREQASWTFRKAPKFFDVVTYTGDGVAGRTISHDLGCDVGMIVVKRTDAAENWAVYHRGVAADPETDRLYLNTNSTAGDNKTFWNDTLPSDSVFTLGTSVVVNASGANYVAYLFAHNDGDGEFGPDGDQDIIKCGSFSSASTGDIENVTVGFEPQWLLIKKTNGTSDWWMADVMRGMPVIDSSSGINTQRLFANKSNAESADPLVGPTPNGFRFYNQFGSSDFIYIAIRRGPLAPPESGTEVFDVDAQAGGSFVTTNFPVDMQINRNRTFASGAVAISRLTGGRALDTSSTGAEGGASYFEFDHQNGIEDNYQGIDGCIYWSFKRAPGFFDVVAYTGDGIAGRTVSHNLGVSPEMIWVKRRDNTDIWVVYNETVGNTGFLRLNDTNAVTTAAVAWNDTSPTATDFTLGTYAAVNTSGSDYIAYLFASLPGISKVGSYTGNGTSQTIDCGFTSGARFILIKRTDSTGDWYVWDTERGIVAGNDPHLSLNTTAAEVTSDDSIDPDNSGFIVNQVSATNINVSSASYIFYSVA